MNIATNETVLADPVSVDLLSDTLFPAGSLPSGTDFQPSESGDVIAVCPVEPVPEDPEIKAIQQQLDAIFGIPKKLTSVEQKLADDINLQIEYLFNETDGELSGEQEKTLDRLNQQLDKLYGVKDWNDLTSDEQKTVQLLYVTLDTLTEEPEETGIMKEEAELYEQLDAIFGIPDRNLTDEEQQKVDDLNRQIESVLIPDDNGEWPELTEEQQTTLNALYDQINDIYGITEYDDLTPEQQANVDKIYARLEELQYSDANLDDGMILGPDTQLPVEPGFISDDHQKLYDRLDEIFNGSEKTELTDDEQVQSVQINSQIEALWAPDENGQWPDLTQEQEQQVDDLFKQLDNLWGIRHYEDLTEVEQAEVEAIYAELDNIDYVDDLVIEPWEDDSELIALYGQLDDIFGLPKQELTEDELAQVDELYAQIDALFEPDADGNWPEADMAQLDGLLSQVDDIYGIKHYDDLTPEEQKTVDNIYQQLVAKAPAIYGFAAGKSLDEEDDDLFWEDIFSGTLSEEGGNELFFDDLFFDNDTTDSGFIWDIVSAATGDFSVDGSFEERDDFLKAEGLEEIELIGLDDLDFDFDFFAF
ncbi:hypothetical protein [Oceanospirillum sediminis]|uniref:Uncharacterized protein n=1 Tax=Oceanospirillum sediminis TaxID=2760088 RepID=A0A839IMP7_9GAMM|nr:hypothetical protein [Oceanospirillum sediminis]MBB1486171.1 hypothetical protein [Oceanospirillum sediminis]